MSLSTANPVSTTLTFSNLPQEILSAHIISFIEYSDAAKISRVSRSFLKAFNENDYHARMKKSLEIGVCQLAPLLKSAIEAFPISMHVHHRNNLDDENETIHQQSIVFRLEQVFGDKIRINIPNIQLMKMPDVNLSSHQPMNSDNQKIFLLKNSGELDSNTFQINIEAVYQSAFLLRLPEMILKNSNKLLDHMGELIENGAEESESHITEWILRFGKSGLSILGSLALIPLYAFSAITVVLIKRRISKLALLSNCKLTMQQEGNFSSQKEKDYIRLCIRKLNHHELFKRDISTQTRTKNIQEKAQDIPLMDYPPLG